MAPKGKVLVTGGAGFIGSHAAESFAREGHPVTVLDNLSRARLLKKDDRNARHNWDFLAGLEGVTLVEGDVREADAVRGAADGAEIIVHAAAQTAVTTSVVDPRQDFENNVLGTFNVLEAARQARRRPAVIYCSTNKVYGENVNALPLEERATRWAFPGEHARGVDETFPVDLCEHTPYGCSKLAGDLYMQDYARLYGVKTGVFRMSCIYGTRQFGMEDQGWVAWFTIAALTGQPLTVFGDGKQVRDLLWVDDLIAAYRRFLGSDRPHGVYNMGGGPEFTLSLRELLELLATRTGGRPLQVATADWRPSDQKVYVSNIDKARRELAWAPRVAPEEGVDRLAAWVAENRRLFA
jgi:CDP-paratose 2-epimerase